MAEKGWIKIYRQLRDCWVWKSKPFSKGQAWIDLLLKANHTDTKILFNGNLTTIKKGQILTSIRKLVDEWGWSKNTVTKFLNLLEEDGMLTRESDNHRTLITIENYSVFQDSKDTESPQVELQPSPQPNPQGSHTLTTYNNDKNYKNDKNNINSGTQEHSFGKHTNVQNLAYVVIHNDLTVNPDLYSIITDWMEYKDQKKKGQNHYDSERGIKTLINKFLENFKDYGLDAVRHAVEESIANNYQGIVWEKAQQFRSGKGNYTYKPQQTTTANDLDPQITAQLRALEERQNETLAEFDNLTDEEIDRMCRGEL